MHNSDISQYSPQALAYLGDAVIEVMVRAKLLREGNAPAGLINKKALLYVTAAAQSKAVDNILPMLNETETNMYKRGRNVKGQTPKHAKVADYRRASGLECLFGYLYLKGDTERISELFAVLYN